ncbi:hypothetical protein [Puia sp.]|jgi:hypothetical protein|uniref:hypothetical protein n=1 Tax=Puia sp. TaxID=2045100 RepID=UPI002F413644
MLQKELITKKDYAAIGEEISHETATEFVESYKQKHAGEREGYILGRNIIDQILAQPGCVGMRFYYGLNEEGQKTLVYVGIDANGQDLLKKTVVMQNGSLGTDHATIADRIGFWPW